MQQPNDEITQHLAERVCWEVARQDDARLARRLYGKQLVDGVYRLDEGAVPVLDDFCHVLEQLGVMALLAEVRGAAAHRDKLPFVQDCLALQLEDAVWDGEYQCVARIVVQR